MTIFGVILFASVILTSCGDNNSKSNSNKQTEKVCSDISGIYTGTSKMGSSTGTAEINISPNCSATLSYNHGSLGSATENGEIYQEGASYKFKKSRGGTYNLTISSNRVVLEGTNWQCIMIK